jgi:TolB-like protein
MGLPAGSRLGVYEIVAPLGAGGMGEVYRARDPRLRRDVAIKVLPPAVAGDPDRRARFEREAHAVASLSHPNILAIHDVGTDQGITYAVMELLDGRTLRGILGNGSLPLREGLSIGTQVARGLDAAHARGLVHRDVKPENVIVLPDGHAKILDFGLVADRSTDVPAEASFEAPTQTPALATRPGTVLGTPGYMSPEQVRGEPADRRSDVFALGCVLYEMLSGRRAFKGDTVVDTLHATLRTEPPDLASATGVSVPIGRIVSRCLAKAPEERFQSAAEVALALEALSSPAPVPRRGAWPLVAIAATLVIASAGGWALWRSRSPARPPSGAEAAGTGARGIAVLPFETIGPTDQAYFAAGVTEEVSLQLAKVSALRVISRSAVARFGKGAADLPAMARELRVGAVLAGTVRHAGHRVRIGVQLIDAPGGETLWSAEYDGDGRNIFAVQSDVALRVARSLQASLAPGERARIERPPTSVPAAYQLFLKEGDVPGTTAEQNREAIDLLERAIALDPKFALAYASLARRYVFLGYVTGREDLRRGVEAGRTAVELDPQLARAHYGLANALTATGEIEAGRLAMLRAIELDSSLRPAILDFSLSETIAGRLDQAMYWAGRALPLAPNLGNSYYHLAVPLILLDEAAAERWLLAAAGRFPRTDTNGGLRLQIMLAALEMRRGQLPTAIERMRAAVAAQPDNFEGQMMLTELTVSARTADARSRVDHALATGPGARGWWTLTTPRTWSAFLWLESGDRGRALPLVAAALAANQKALDEGDRSPGPPYENAALCLMRGDRAAALDWLDRAYAAGFRDPPTLLHDPTLAAVAAEPRFVRLVGRMRQDVQEMRARVDLSTLEPWMSGAPGP